MLMTGIGNPLRVLTEHKDQLASLCCALSNSSKQDDECFFIRGIFSKAKNINAWIFTSTYSKKWCWLLRRCAKEIMALKGERMFELPVTPSFKTVRKKYTDSRWKMIDTTRGRVIWGGSVTNRERFYSEVFLARTASRKDGVYAAASNLPFP